MSSQSVHPQNSLLTPIEIAIRRLPNSGGLPLPAYASDGAAGMDVVAAETLTLRPGTRHAVATGFAMAIPPGYEVQVRPRSGLALKYGITCLNTPGTIDSDYRGEVKVILANLSEDNFEITRGDRIAQLVPAPVQRATYAEVETLGDTARGAGGFGRIKTRALKSCYAALFGVVRGVRPTWKYPRPDSPVAARGFPFSAPCRPSIAADRPRFRPLSAF